MPAIDLSILNQRQTPAFYADTLANRPAAGFVGRIFVSTNTFAFYRDNGTGWDLIGGPGTGTITGSGTAGTVPLWSGASTIGDSTLIEAATKFTTIKDIQADAFYLNGMTAGSGALYWTSDRVTLANYNVGGEVRIEVNGGTYAQIIAANGSTTFAGSIIQQGGTSSQFLKADGSVDSNTYNTGSGAVGQVTYWNGTNAITGDNGLFYNSASDFLGIGTNTPGAALDVHSSINVIQQLNQTTATNNSLLAFQNSGTGLWRIGNFYNAGANDLGIFDVVGAIQPLTVKKTTGQVLIGTSTVGSGKLVVASATGDNGIQIVGASAPSLRIDNAESGPTKRAGFGISTATNNFIQGSADRDFCMFNGSTTASSILFGIYGTTNVQEAARISAARNFLIGTTTDNGSKLQVSGSATFSSNVIASGYVEGSINDGSNTWAPILLMTNNSTGANDYAWGKTTVNDLSLRNINNGYYPITFQNQGTYSNVGINNIAPAAILDVRGAVPLARIGLTSGGYVELSDNQLSAKTSSGTASDLYLNIAGAKTILNRDAGNVLIGTTTDAGYRLSVNGSGYIKSVLAIDNNGVDAGTTEYLRFERNSQGSANYFNSIYSGTGSGSNLMQFRLSNTSGSQNTIFSLSGNGVINMANIPTSAAGLSSGDIYRLGTVLNIVP